VVWVNKTVELGEPFDLVVQWMETADGGSDWREAGSGSTEFIEVKTTVTSDKSVFEMSHREWQFAQLKVSHSP